MEFKKVKTRLRSVDYSPNVISQRHKQKHDLQFILKDAKDGLFELGWEIKIVENNLIRVKIVTTDIYEIKNLKTEATEQQLKKLIYETFQEAESKYNEQKIPLSLASQLKYSPNDEMPQILRELTRILRSLGESSTQ